MSSRPPSPAAHATIDGFRGAMLAAGITPPDAIHADGLLHRFRIEGDKAGSRNGWYVLHGDRRAAGAFGSWRLGIVTTWRAEGGHLSQAEAAGLSAAIAAARKQADADRRRRHEACAAEAREEWTAAGPADPAHPYLIRKRVKPYNLRQRGGLLLVPLFDEYGLPWNLQRIQADGTKRFRPGRAGGLFSPIGDFAAPQTILVCEGWATGATLYEEAGHPVLCAMNAGNLRPVAEVARRAWRAADLVICGDNDRFTPGNPGVTAATEAARATGARLAIPQFADGEPGSDFNDLAAIRRKGARHE